MIQNLWMFHCGGAHTARQLFVRSDERERAFLPFLGFVLQHTTQGPLLVDAPQGPAGPDMYGALRSWVHRRLSGVVFEPAWSTRHRVVEIGIHPDELACGVLTHMHFDHTGGMSEFPSLIWHPSLEEWRHAQARAGFKAELRGYVPENWAASMRNGNIQGHTWDPCPEELSMFDGCKDLFQDGSVLLVSLPGHAAGHQGVLITSTQGRKIFLCGDALFDRAHLTSDDSVGWGPRRFAGSAPDMFTTLAALRTYAQRNPETLIVPSHDFDFGQQCYENPIDLLAGSD